MSDLSSFVTLGRPPSRLHMLGLTESQYTECHGHVRYPLPGLAGQSKPFSGCGRCNYWEPHVRVGYRVGTKSEPSYLQKEVTTAFPLEVLPLLDTPTVP
ncbi:hypothetical protein Bpfe_002803 [Biomphalaria pfeifferi]|uniref:Uncharacterized protein n=1 Tax=Biomphalaria pfeifferi TaxID=112525 RepID=A0AAD8C7P7_BIOPF|nr:hypothetical protein Bpfe_002803 [Biomphalaria pfeifferi]